MLKKLFARLIWAPVGFAAVVFLVANRHMVRISFDPFTTREPFLEAPLWVWLMLMLLAGFFIGAAAMWTSGRDARRRAHADRQEVKKLQRELAKAQASQAANDPDGSVPLLKAS